MGGWKGTVLLDYMAYVTAGFQNFASIITEGW